MEFPTIKNLETKPQATATKSSRKTHKTKNNTKKHTHFFFQNPKKTLFLDWTSQFFLKKRGIKQLLVLHSTNYLRRHDEEESTNNNNNHEKPSLF